VKDLALPSRSVVLADVSEKSGAVVWRAYLDRLLASRRGVRLCLYDHDKLERAICVGDQTAPLVVAVHDHPGIDADKYQQDAEANNGELVMQHAMGSTSPFSELYRVMSTDGELGETWCARMAEAAITPIVILDERVQEAAWPNTSRRHGKELEAMGVFVPDLEATGDLKATTPAQVDAYLTRLKSSRPWTHEVPKRYLIIHRSVMQRLNSLGAADKYPGSFKDAGYEVRIVSGAAGGPEIGMGDDPYVALAGLEQHAIRVPCKWQLSEMVVTARNQQKRT